MLKSLLWKEYRESRWKMLAIFAMYLFLVLLVRVFEPRYPGELAAAMILLMAILMPGIVAMGTIADERVRRTADTLLALPISPDRVFLIKTLAGLATALLPLVAVEGLCFLIFPTHTFSRTALDNVNADLLSLVGATVTLFLWTLALAAPRKTELGVGVTYVLMFLGLALVSVLVPLANRYTMYRVGNGVRYSNIPTYLLSLSPVGFLTGHPQLYSDNQPHWGITPYLQLITWLPLWEIALWRHSRTPVARIARPLDQPAAVLKTILRPRRFPILWKSWRESRALVLSYTLLVLAFIAVDSLVIQHSLDKGRYFYSGPGMLVFVPAILSLVTIILLGTDIGLREAETHLESFWHSRPIPQATYFRRRFDFGLVMALLLVVTPAALSLAITSHQLATTNPPPAEVLNPGAHFTVRSSEGVLIKEGVYPLRSPDWPPSRDPYAVITLLDGLKNAQQHLTTVLLIYTPHALLFYALSTFIATLARRRIIPLVLSFGCALAFELHFYSSDGPELRSFFRLIRLTLGPDWTVYWLGCTVYWALMLAASTLFTCLATLSTAAHWRARLEAHLEPRAELLPTP